MSVMQWMGFNIGEAATDTPVITAKPPSIKKKYKMWGSDNEAAAYSAFAQLMPQTTRHPAGYPLYRDGMTVTRVATKVFEAEISFGIRVFPVQFDTSGASTEIYQSLSTIHKYPEDAPDFNGGINYNPETKQFDGCTVIRPQFSWTETFTFQIEQINWGYVKTLRNLTGCANEKAFREFDPGEVTFLGSNGGTQKNDTEVDISFKFSSEENYDNLTIGPISGIKKDGSDFLWVLYKPTVPSNTKPRFAEPKAVYVERVSARVDFKLLGIDESDLP
jgi:hypothetical protein